MTDHPTSPTAPATKRARADGWLCSVSWVGGNSTEEWHWVERLVSDTVTACAGAGAFGVGPRDEPPADGDVCSLCRINYDAERGIPEDAWMREGDRVIPM